MKAALRLQHSEEALKIETLNLGLHGTPMSRQLKPLLFKERNNDSKIAQTSQLTQCVILVWKNNDPQDLKYRFESRDILESDIRYFPLVYLHRAENLVKSQFLQKRGPRTPSLMSFLNVQHEIYQSSKYKRQVMSAVTVVHSVVCCRIISAHVWIPPSRLVQNETINPLAMLRNLIKVSVSPERQRKMDY